MKHLSEKQKEVEELAKRVSPLSEEQKEWAKKNFTYFIQTMQGDGDCRCPECHTHLNCYDTPHKEKKSRSYYYGSHIELRCPYCGAKIQVGVISATYADSCRTRRTPKQEDFIQVLDTIGGWQVTRLFYMRRYCYVRKPNTDWEFWEVCQGWNHPSERKTYWRSLPKVMMGSWCFNPYSLCGYDTLKIVNGQYVWHYVPHELEPRKPGSSHYFSLDAIAPKAKILPYYRKRGLTASTIDKSEELGFFGLCEGFSEKNYKPMYETLWKAKAYKVFDKVVCKWNRKNADIYFTAWKVCQRNHYKPTDENEWFDLVDMLSELRLDYHNPHYVCPADLHEMHQALVRQKKRKEDEIKLRKAMEKNKEYMARVAKYMDMEIRQGDMSIIVLPTIKAFKDEADHLCHCVWRCEYYNKPDSLILSARDDSGKRWETLEVSLKRLDIMQCYGYGDKFTKRHEEILSLMQNNMWQIKERRSGKKARARVSC